jgi:hypothetical protein
VTEPLSEQQLAEIAERVLTATPGPWELYPDYGPNFYANVRGEMLLPVGSIEFGDGETAAADRAIVEHAVEDLAALLSEVERLSEALTREQRLYAAYQKSAAETGRAMRAEIDRLQAERHATNEALDEAIKAIRAKDQRIAELEKAAAEVTEFVAARAEYITSIRNCHPDNAHDYDRWQGHAEARRQLAQKLGLPVAWPEDTEGGESR